MSEPISLEKAKELREKLDAATSALFALEEAIAPAEERGTILAHLRVLVYGHRRDVNWAVGNFVRGKGFP